MAAASDELIEFVHDALKHGMSRAQVQQVLEQAGWTARQVNGALHAFAPVDCPVPVPRPRPSLSARDAFFYLLLFTTLYIVTFNLGSLVFQLIDRALPDPASAATDAMTRDAIRFAVSALVVGLPVFLFMSHVTNRIVKGDPAAAASPVRRWLTYLTLFVAACVLLGDFTSLVYSVLGGELTVRFVLKSLTVGIIAGAGFWYYLSDLRRDEKAAMP